MYDQTLSKEIAAKVGAIQKECYLNSFRGVTYFTGAVYVEGYAMKEGLIPLEHGWIELQDGTIVDPTWCDSEINVYSPLIKVNIIELIPLVEKAHGTLPVAFINHMVTSDQVIAAIQDCINQMNELGH